MLHKVSKMATAPGATSQDPHTESVAKSSSTPADGINISCPGACKSKEQKILCTPGCEVASFQIVGIG